MIGKITTGSNFDRLFRYLLKDDKQARILGGDRLLVKPNAKELASQFNWIASTRPTTKKPVKHISIGFAPTDGEVDDSIKVAVSETIVNQLGYINNQWVAIAHGRNDPGHDWQHDHDHIHIVVNGIDFNGERVSDSFDKTRLEKILRELELEHNLTTVVSSNVCARQRPKTNQLQRYQRENKKYVQQKPEIPVMAKLEAAIDVASRDRPTMTSFIGRMQQLGIDVRACITEKGKKGISYRLGDFKVRGCKLHNGSLTKLLSKRDIDFDEVRDTPALEAAYQGKSVQIDNKQSLSWEQVDLDYWLPQSLKALANQPLWGKAEVKRQRAEGNNRLRNRFQTEKLISDETTDVDVADKTKSHDERSFNSIASKSESLRQSKYLVPSASCPLEGLSPESNSGVYTPRPSAFTTEDIREIPNPKQWNNLQKTLLARYGIPEHISAGLHEAELLYASEKGQPIWHKRSLLGSKNSHFWFDINDNGDRVKKIVITNSPVEAVSAYLVERLVNRENSSCLYLSLDRPEQLKELDLTNFDTVIVNSRDKQLVSDRVSNLVIQENTSSWQQSWLAHWNKVKTSLKSEAKNTSIEKKPNKTMELEL
ncbi:MAG: relaxase/mobilization nuclease domain-containing protein [Xenococcaceae cyanobacterium]